MRSHFSHASGSAGEFLPTQAGFVIPAQVGFVIPAQAGITNKQMHLT
jgi:hypothetical protein